MPSRKPHIILDVCKASDKNFFSKFPKLYSDLIKGKIRPVRGGNKYKKEVGKCVNLRRLFTLLKDSGFVIDVTDAIIDASESTLNTSIGNSSRRCRKACDDAHLFALAKHSSAKYAISSDARIARCRRELNSSSTPQDHFSQLGVIQSECSYIRLRNKQSL